MLLQNSSCSQREEFEYVRKTTADIKFSEEGGGGGQVLEWRFPCRP